MSTFYIKQGDTLPKYEVELTDASGKALDLTNVSAVKLNLTRVKDSTGKAVTDTNVQKTGTVDGTATLGHVSYTFVSGDWSPTPMATGTYDAEWQLTYSGGQVRTVPTNGYDEVVVLPDLD